MADTAERSGGGRYLSDIESCERPDAAGTSCNRGYVARRARTGERVIDQYMGNASFIIGS